jgi:hypothetical protein
MRSLRALIAGLLASIAVACTSHAQPDAAQRIDARESSMQQFSQQPFTNPRYKRLVAEQSIEDPHHTGRPIEQ